MIIQYITDFILSVISFFFCFYLPGNIILKKVKINLENFEFHIFSVAIGFVLFTLLSFIFYISKVFYLIIPALLLINIYSLSKLKFKKPNFKLLYNKGGIFIYERQ